MAIETPRIKSIGADAAAAGKKADAAEKQAASLDTVAGYKAMWDAALNAQDAYQRLIAAIDDPTAIKEYKRKVEYFAERALKAQRVMNATAMQKKVSPIKAFAKSESK